MDRMEGILLSETEKWLKRLKIEFGKSRLKDPGNKEHKGLETNIKAYIEDTGHFIIKKDYLRAFEAIVYAWGLYEAGLRLRVFQK